MSQLRKAMEECERDTNETLGKGPATRLAKWRQYASDEPALVAYIQRVIRGANNSNGWKLDQAGKLSLERIVVDRCPELFTAEDKLVAKNTLDIKGRSQ